MSKDAFNSTVAKRTRSAMQIRDTPELMAIFQGVGGLQADLDAIVEAGQKAEAHNVLQSQAAGTSKVNTVDVGKAFVALQREYTAVMAVVHVVSESFKRSGEAELAARLDQILVNEAQVTISTDAAGKKTATRSRSQEALRAEIEKDATALFGCPNGIITALKGRGVDQARLQALKDAASGLSGKLANRTAGQGARKAATADEKNAVRAQNQAWGAAYRILMLAAEKDARIKALLHDAAA